MVTTYKAARQVGVKPDVDMYSLLLEGRIVAHHRELEDRLLEGHEGPGD